MQLTFYRQPLLDVEDISALLYSYRVDVQARRMQTRQTNAKNTI